MRHNLLPGAKKGCSIGGKCEKCPHYVSMPVDIQDPTTGEVIEKGTAWDCVFYWLMLGAWDGGRQGQFTHGAVQKMHNTLIAATQRPPQPAEIHELPAQETPVALPSESKA